jgi:hypothetical protein
MSSAREAPCGYSESRETIHLVSNAVSRPETFYREVDVSDDRPRDGGRYPIERPGARRGDRDDELGGVCEAAVDQPARETIVTAEPVTTQSGRSGATCSRTAAIGTGATSQLIPL